MTYLQDSVINVLENVSLKYSILKTIGLYLIHTIIITRRRHKVFTILDLIASLTIWIAGSWTGGIVLVLLRRSSRDRQLVFRSGLAQPLRRGAAFVSSASRWHRGRRQCRRGWRGGTIKYELGYLPATNSGAVGTFV